MWGKVDHLRGLKENVIMGRLIPAGTGMARYQRIGIQIEAPESDEIVEPESPGRAAGGGAYSQPAEGLMAAPGTRSDPLET